MIFSSKDYLPNSEDRIEHLRKVINGRTVAILLAGPSIDELEKRVKKLRDVDICYFGMNSFTQEKHILQQIDKRLSVYMDSCPKNIPNTIKDIIEYLDRGDDNMFVSSFINDTFKLIKRDFDLKRFIAKYDEKLIFFGLKSDLERTVPNSNFPMHFIAPSNSLQVLIQLAIIGKASGVLLFGADGYCAENIEKFYYRQDKYNTRWPLKYLIYDTNNFNLLAPIAINNTYKTYDLPRIDILNCSENSFNKPFPKVSYDSAFEYLLTGKKIEKKPYSGVLKISVISPCLNAGNFSEETVKNISHQSHANFEHIIFYRDDDEKMQAIRRNFPHVKWIQVKDTGYAHAFKNAVSASRGEYIFYCSMGSGYSNEDWFNVCAEFLENNPDISLVWGFSQLMHEDDAPGRVVNDYLFDKPPSQGKNFIYYWLKKKILFPEGNFCVRKKVLEECFPSGCLETNDEREAWVDFNYNFNVSGYQPYFIPLVANYYMIRRDKEKEMSDLNTKDPVLAYRRNIKRYGRKLILRRTTHCYRKGSGEALSYGFSHISFLFFDIGRYIKNKMPGIFVPAMEKFLYLRGVWRQKTQSNCR